eukprot:TRINITY_DN1163_c0_g1_i8.p1 TRINITY_DN1163_c0_g1~~TRINITY_DN1163_c0_g1_i8.p1  ORF type:complete len:549 (+),score=58.87 TRINITY_DN1163_c0_g1_i8:937-2583(+)
MNKIIVRFGCQGRGDNILVIYQLEIVMSSCQLFCVPIQAHRKNLSLKSQFSQIGVNRYSRLQKVNIALPYTAQIATQQPTKQHLFSWTKQWYPIQILSDLDEDRPTAVQLLGKDLVLWKGGEGNWVCFEDQCPHRLVPLSEGRLETDGTLQCAYHAWRFNSKGECVKIPQAEPEQEKKLCSNERARAKVFPTQEKHGLLWVWGESGADAHLESLSKPPAPIDVLESPNAKQMRWISRDLPYSHEFLLENVVDQAHVTVSHHGQQAHDRKKAKPVFMKMQNPMHAVDGFRMYFSLDKKIMDLGDLQNQNFVQFLPPSFVVYQYRNYPGIVANLVLISTPTTKFQNRLFLTSAFEGERGDKITKVSKRRPVWIFHLGQNKFFQQDNVFLFKQEKTIQKKNLEGVNIPKGFYTPTSSDSSVLQLHKWFNMYAQGGVQYFSEMVPKIQKDNDLTDTYTQHTKNCKVCLGALANFQKLQVGAWIACTTCAVCAICNIIVSPLQPVNLFSIVVKLPALKNFVPAVFSIAFAAIGIYSNQTIKKYYKTEFSHADN